MAERQEKQEGEKLLYMRIYSWFREQIETGKMPAGEKLPSLRNAAKELSISRTTAETAYLQLAADGYIQAKPGSGYYVTGRPGRAAQKKTDKKKSAKEDIRYDFSAASVDREGFRLDLWRRYVKSAMRKDERLYSYGEAQGETELREELARYVARSRNIHCRPEDIVIGAGIQSLLELLCPLLPKGSVSFPNPSFAQSRRIFRDHGFTAEYRKKDADYIYVSPSRMTRWGSVMPLGRRLELLKTSAKDHRLIIEDDYESEFVPAEQKAPALHSLSGGRGVVYLGTFSRLLLPSIRLSFMILPDELAAAYRERAGDYNQTASKIEQIALAQFIGDGHMEALIRRLRRLYEAKTARLKEALTEAFGKLPDAKIPEITGSSLSAVIVLPEALPEERRPRYALEDEESARIYRALTAAGIRPDQAVRDRDGRLKVILSSLSYREEELAAGAEAVAAVLAGISFAEKDLNP